MIVKGKLITGLSGGEFGVIGKIQARDPDTGEEIWSRPVIEGNVGELNGKPSTMTGKLNETWARRHLQVRWRRDLARRHL